MTADTAGDHQSRSPHEIFTWMSKKFQLAVVARALKHRGNASEDLRGPLETWVQKLPIDGFRAVNAIKAPSEKLQRPILKAIGPGAHSLARAVLNLWMESHQALRETTLAHLDGRGIPAPNDADAWFDAPWSPAEWHCERKAITTGDPALEEDEVELMLCLTSGRFPPTVASPLFHDWLNRLRDLPPDANEWAEADTFIEWVDVVSQEKQGELHAWHMEEVKRICDDMRKRFDQDLRYLGIDPGLWQSELEKRPDLAGQTLEHAKSLCDALEAYHSIRPQAATRDEELQRSQERGQREEAILQLVNAWQESLKQSDPAEEPAPESEDPADGYPPDPGAIPIDTSCIFISSSSVSNKNHETIWGKPVRTFHDIPARAQRVFKVIWEVPGITRITLGPKTHRRSKSSLGATVSEPQRPPATKEGLNNPISEGARWVAV